MKKLKSLGQLFFRNLFIKKFNYFFIVFSLSLYLNLTPSKSDEIFNLGKSIFLKKGNCAMCHALDDAGSEGQIGPYLDLIKPEEQQILNAVTNGIGVMPAYENLLSNEEIEAVVYYVFTSINN